MEQPNLSRNPFVACIQLLIWLVFYPSVWRAFVVQMAPALPADFALSRLNLAQWRQPDLLRLLGLVYITMPILVGTIVGLCLWGVTNDLSITIRGIIYTITLSFVGGLTSGITVSVAFSLVASMISGLLIGGFFWIVDNVQWYRVAILSGIFAISLASSVLISLASYSQQSRFKISLLVASIIFSGAIVVSGVILYTSIFIVFYLLSLFGTVQLTDIKLQMTGLAVGIGLIFGLATHRWLWAGILTLVFWVVMTILLSGIESHQIETHTMLLDALMGGISNGLLFALLFTLPYLLTRYVVNSAWAGIVAGIFGSGGVYVAIFMWRQPEHSIFLLSILAMTLGLSQHWWQIAQFFKQKLHTVSRHIAETTADHKMENPYIVGVPLTTEYNKNIFMGRKDMSARIELLLRNQRSPPILLHGQRRIGKTSLLNFLNDLDFLPNTYVPLFIDLQGPVSWATDHGGFFYELSRTMIKSAYNNRQLILPAISREVLQLDPFPKFDEWLDQIEASVEGRTLLLIFDEFEVLEEAFKQGNLEKASVLGMFRHIIQHRSRFKILMAGVHRLDIFPDWTSYLINVETLHLSYLQSSEAKQLIEEPVKQTLRYTSAATEHILALTHCHPALIQLLCKEIVFIKYEQTHRGRNVVQKSEVEVAIPNAFKSGKNYFTHINQRPPAEQKILRFLASQGQGATANQEVLARHCEIESIENILANLLQYEIIELTPKGYRFQIELIRRWFDS